MFIVINENANMKESSDYIAQLIMLLDLPMGKAVELWHAGVATWSLTDILLMPYYIYLMGFYYATVWFEFATNGVMYMVAFAVVAFLVMNRIYLGEYQSVKYGTLTLVNIYHPRKRAFNFIKCMFWGIFSPFYGFWLMLTKGLALLAMCYVLPYMLVRRMFDKNYFDSAPIGDTQARYARTYGKESTTCFWDVYREK